MPRHVGSVKNVTIKEYSPYLYVHWERPDFIDYCKSLTFLVTANSNKETSTCLGSVTCHLTLRNYCPITTVEIKVNEVPGDVVYIDYVCSSYYKSNSVRFCFHKLLSPMNIYISMLFF